MKTGQSSIKRIWKRRSVAKMKGMDNSRSLAATTKHKANLVAADLMTLIIAMM
jgi:hypothetical protein